MTIETHTHLLISAAAALAILDGANLLQEVPLKKVKGDSLIMTTDQNNFLLRLELCM